jgi:transcriptional regulator of arginine metabolism
MSTKAVRQELLRVLLRERELGSQQAVRDALAEQGIETHPATVGRDLEELGAVKVRTDDGHLVYRAQGLDGVRPSRAATVASMPPSAPRDVLDEALETFVTSVAVAGNLLVLRTPPACASPVASALDSFGGPSILGTIAGDDTVVAVVADGHDPRRVAEDLRRRVRPAA